MPINKLIKPTQRASQVYISTKTVAYTNKYFIHLHQKTTTRVVLYKAYNLMKS